MQRTQDRDARARAGIIYLHVHALIRKGPITERRDARSVSGQGRCAENTITLHVGFSLKGRTKLLQRDDKLKSINMLD